MLVAPALRCVNGGLLWNTKRGKTLFRQSQYAAKLQVYITLKVGNNTNKIDEELENLEEIDGTNYDRMNSGLEKNNLIEKIVIYIFLILIISMSYSRKSKEKKLSTAKNP